MELTEQEIVRRNKLEEIKKITNPHPERFVITHSLKEASLLIDGTKNVSVAGRIVLMRKMGKLSFLTIKDITGKIQISIKQDMVGEVKYQQFKEMFDLGDFIGVTGEIFTTHTNELTVRADSYIFLGKALKPLPEKFHGLIDIELRYRQRYIDLITNDETKNRFILRSKIIKEIRNYLDNLDYIEIETPILNNKPSGALAKPFIAHHDAQNIDVYLRIAPETYLKRAIIGGFTKVYEIGRCFRNEGIDSTHLQDFTMLEAYHAYYNYQDNMKLIEDMLKILIKKLFKSTVININNQEIDLDKPWEVISFRDLIKKYIDLDINIYNTKEKLLDKLQQLDISFNKDIEVEKLGYGQLIDQLYKKVCRPNILSPIFLTEHPISLSPLARANDNNKEITDRFQLVIGSAELVNGYSELVDAIEQRKRLEEQANLNQNGDEEAMIMDEDYLEAMSYGMPPISGWGMGIDRLVQILTNAENIKDCVLFPLMKQDK